MIIDDKKYAVFTIDVESFADTECVQYSGMSVNNDMLDGFDRYIKLLDRHNIPATMFAVCETAMKLKTQVKQYINRGHSLALHGFKHVVPITLSDEQFRRDTLTAKRILEEEFDVSIKGYRAPCFGMDNSKLQILRDLGFCYDSSRLDFGHRHNSTLDLDNFIKPTESVFSKDGFFEFGLACQKILGLTFPVSGGGYMRLFNWSIIKSAIYNYLKSHNYYVFYIHPFELSNERVSPDSSMKSYDKYYLTHGFDTYASKIETLIDMLKKLDYTFVTFDQLTEIMSNKKATV